MKKNELEKDIEYILKQYSDYVYFEGDPRRNGMSARKTIDSLLKLMEKEREEKKCPKCNYSLCEDCLKTLGGIERSRVKK